MGSCLHLCNLEDKNSSYSRLRIRRKTITQLMISSSKFRQQNAVFFSCPVQHRNAKVDRGANGYPIVTPATDYLDINKNNQLDFRLEGSHHDIKKHMLVADEPCLGQPLSELSDLARTMETEVLTQEDVKGVQYGYPARRYRRLSQPQTKLNSLDDLDLSRAMPRDIQWAIDFEKQEFLLYRKS